MKSLSKVVLMLLGIIAVSSLSSVQADAIKAKTSIVDEFKHKSIAAAYADDCKLSAEDAKDPEKVRQD
jgi:hypothetical protein